MERRDKESNREFYDTQRADDRRRFNERPAKRFFGETLTRWIVPQLASGARLADIAGGSGAYTSRIGELAGVSVVGLDISESMVRQRGGDPYLPLNVVGDMEALPFASASFDAVVFVAALHHVPDALPALEEAWRVLRPGGRLFAREPCSLRAGAGGVAAIEGTEQEFRIALPYLVDRVRRAGFELDELIPLQLTMRLVGRAVASPSLALCRASERLDRVLFRLPPLRRLAEGCMIAATKPPAGAARLPSLAAGELARLLACPACGGELREEPRGLVCARGGELYEVSDGVAILLRPDPASAERAYLRDV